MNDRNIDQEIRKDCCIAGSELCYWLDSEKGCSACYISAMKYDSEKEKALSNWKVMLSNMPEDVDDIYLKGECPLCKGEPKEGKYYASVDMAHPEPETKKGMILGFGKKVRVPVGSLFSVKFKVCKDCKKILRAIDLSLIVSAVIGIIAGFVITSIPAIGDKLMEINEFLGILIFFAFVAAGFGIGALIAAYFRKKAYEKMHIEMKDIPLFKEMLRRRWFFFQESKGIPKIYFSRKEDFKGLFGFAVKAKEEKEEVKEAVFEETEKVLEDAPEKTEKKEDIEDTWSKFID